MYCFEALIISCALIMSYSVFLGFISYTLMDQGLHVTLGVALLYCFDDNTIVFNFLFLWPDLFDFNFIVVYLVKVKIK